MSRSFSGKRKRQDPHTTPSAPESGALILSGDAALVDYEEKIPLWKQEVVDERGRKRLHGAFTGGFSAGYFNTVGSKEGWTPASFASSRTARYKAENNRVIDYMDEEDLADIVDDRALRLKNAEAQADAGESQGKASESSKREDDSSYGPEAMNDNTADKNLALVVKSHVSRKKVAKPLSLLDEEEDIDGYDLGPKIKYDRDLSKKKKVKAAVGAMVQHTFQSRKTLRNPEPEPELVQPVKTPESTSRPAHIDRLLPSIGDGGTGRSGQECRQGQAQSAPDEIRATGDESRARPMTPEASSAIIPPWRRKKDPTPAVVGVGKNLALLALKSTFTPYTADPAKKARYRQYLETEAGVPGAAYSQGDLEPDTWQAECEEFKKCAMMYKPMTGVMSQKFTSSVHKDSANGPGDAAEEQFVVVPQPLQAARDGKFGHLTRSIEPWIPTKLLCKRFEITLPDSDGKERSRGGRIHDPSGAEVNRTALEALMRTA